MDKTYFILKSYSYPPSGPIALGRIIESPSFPGRSLNPGPLPSTSTDNDIITSKVLDWKLYSEKQPSRKIGIWASFIGSVDVGGELS